MSFFSRSFVYSDRRGRWTPPKGQQKKIKKMKLKLMAVAALVACSAVAMPTDDELAKATKEVQASLEKKNQQETK